MKLFYTKRSPYASKVRAVAIEKGIELELIEVADLSVKTPELIAANPLGKVPALVIDGKNSLFDSPVICLYLDEKGSGAKLIPQDSDKRFAALRVEAMADGLMDSTVAVMLEKMRPEDKRFDGAINRQMITVHKILDYFNNNIGQINGELNIGQLALASALGYINLRMSEIAWGEHYPALKQWYDVIEKRDSIASTKPVVA